MSIGLHGEVFLCVCEGWLPISVGNILDFNSFDEVYQSSKAKEIQQTIIDKSYKHCARHICGRGHQRDIPPSRLKNLILTYDRGCNLACPSCRTEMINQTQGSEKINDHVVSLLNNISNHVLVNVCGSGDPFGSKVFRNFLYTLDNEYIRLDIQTNGLLLKKSWPKINPAYVDQIRISFDAATAETYAITRFPGDFNILLENVEFISQERKKHNFRLIGDFVIQQANYKEMINYVELLESYGFDTANFSFIQQWAQPMEVYRQRKVDENILRKYLTDDKIIKNASIEVHLPNYS